MGGEGLHTNFLGQSLHFRISLDDLFGVCQLLYGDLRLGSFGQLIQSFNLPLAILEGNDNVERVSVR